MMIIRHCLLIFTFVIWYSATTATDKEAKPSPSTSRDQESIQNNYISADKRKLFILVFNETEFKKKLRRKRDTSDNTDIKAIVATINDHRTIMDDHRTMINNIINNSINTNLIQRAVAYHYSNIPPAWNSWRDIALVVLLLALFVQIFYWCVCHVKLRPWDYFISRIFQCYHTRQTKQGQEFSQPYIFNHRAEIDQKDNDEHRFIVQKPLVSTIEDDYVAIRNSDCVLQSAKKT